MFNGCFSDRKGCPSGQCNKTLHVRIRPAFVTARPSSIAPKELGKRFQNLGDATGTMPFSLHHVAYAAYTSDLAVSSVVVRPMSASLTQACTEFVSVRAA